MKNVPLTLLLTLLLLSSCFKKSGTTTVEGTAIDMYSRKGIPNAEVFLHSFSGPTGAGYSSKEITRADENGNFTFSFDASVNTSYEVVAGIFDLYKPKSNDGVNIQKGKKNTGLVVECKPVGWVRVNIVNTEPRDSVNTLFAGPFWQPKEFNMSYTNIDTSIIALVLDGGDSSYFSIVTVSQTGQTKHDRYRYFQPSHDTTTITITY